MKYSDREQSNPGKSYAFTIHDERLHAGQADHFEDVLLQRAHQRQLHESPARQRRRPDMLFVLRHARRRQIVLLLITRALCSMRLQLH